MKKKFQKKEIEEVKNSKKMRMETSGLRNNFIGLVWQQGSGPKGNQP